MTGKVMNDKNKKNPLKRMGAKPLVLGFRFGLIRARSNLPLVEPHVGSNVWLDVYRHVSHECRDIAWQSLKRPEKWPWRTNCMINMAHQLEGGRRICL